MHDTHLPEDDDKPVDVPDDRLAESEEDDYGYRDLEDEEDSEEEAEEDNPDAMQDLGLEDGEDFEVEDMYGTDRYAPL